METLQQKDFSYLEELKDEMSFYLEMYEATGAGSAFLRARELQKQIDEEHIRLTGKEYQRDF